MIPDLWQFETNCWNIDDWPGNFHAGLSGSLSLIGEAFPRDLADDLLQDKLGRVLCVLEAKREDLDPYDAKEQDRGYAENLTAPFVILSAKRVCRIL